MELEDQGYWTVYANEKEADTAGRLHPSSQHISAHMCMLSLNLELALTLFLTSTLVRIHTLAPEML